MGSSLRAALGVVVPFALALAAWVAFAPREQVESMGDGRGRVLPSASSPPADQLLLLAALVAVASVVAAVVVGRATGRSGRPGRGPGSVGAVAAAVLVPALATALTVTLASPLASAVRAPDPSAPAGTVVAIPPEVGALFRGPAMGLFGGPSWSSAPEWLGWAVLSAVVAATATAWRVYGRAVHTGSAGTTPETAER